MPGDIIFDSSIAIEIAENLCRVAMRHLEYTTSMECIRALCIREMACSGNFLVGPKQESKKPSPETIAWMERWHKRK